MDDRVVHTLGIDVEFPYKLYDPQRRFIETIIKSIENSQNAIIESPTGTGKTLCLVTSAFSYLLSNRVPGLKIIYTTRTHAQIRHIYSEIKKTSYLSKLYNNDIYMTILASRDKLCVHSNCSKMTGSALINYCKALVHSKRCTYYNGCTAKDIKTVAAIVDIEELIHMGKKHGFCPFYSVRDSQQISQFLLMPYNYLLSQSIRASIDLDLSNTVIIIDEAHNIDDFAERLSSFSIQEFDIVKVLDAAHRALEAANSTDDEEIDFDKILSLSSTLQSVELFFSSLSKVNLDVHLKAEAFDENVLLLDTLSVLKSLNISISSDKLKDSLEEGFDALSLALISTEEGFNSRINEEMHAIGRLKNALTQLVSEWFYVNNQYFFTLLVTENESNRSLQFECMNPVCTFLKLQKEKIRNFIFTSGTISPVNNFICNIGGDVIKFPLILENDHIVTPDRTWAGSISSKFKTENKSALKTNSLDTKLISTYDNRTDSEYISKLGSLLKTFVNAVPGGVLCFFPSYSNMNATIKSWKSTGVYNQISRAKEIFIEHIKTSDKSDQMDDDFKSYKNLINSGKGTIFFAVFRGKIAEGLDFPNDYCRGVFICGIPYPNPHHFRVALKMKYLDYMKAEGHDYYDRTAWYVANATRAVNQALGRCIRHVDDYGAVLFADVRYEYTYVKAYISKWLLRSFEVYNDINSVSASLEMFFRKFGKPSANTLFNWISPDIPDNSQLNEDESQDLYDELYEKELSQKHERVIPLQGRPKKKERTNRSKHTVIGLLDKDIDTVEDKCDDPILSWYKPSVAKSMDRFVFD